MTTHPSIRVRGARQHNLKNIDVDIPRGSLTVITGLSGSGKSSLAFDTIYAEGQRKYVESLSAYARQFLEQMQKPDVDRIEGLSPTIAIEQRSTASSPRSTIATTTEIYDFLRVLFARAGEACCWKCDRPIELQSTSQVVDAVLAGPEGVRIMVLGPLVSGQRGQHKTVLERIAKEGFVRARIDGEVTLLEDTGPLPANRKHTIEVVVDRLVTKPTIRQRLADSVELATRLSGGRIVITAEVKPGKWSDEVYSAALSCPIHDDVRIDEINPQLFSFNSPQGACELCHGLGTTQEFDPELIIPDRDLSLAEGAVVAWRHHGRRANELYAGMLQEFCERFGVLKNIPFRNIPKRPSHILLYGTSEAEAREYEAAFEGIIPNLKRVWQTTESESMKQRLHSFLYESPCERCRGTRLKEQALAVRIDGRSIADFAAQTVSVALDLFDNLRFTGEAQVVAEPLVREIRQRLGFMCDVGVEYLSLDRASASLSGGEWQRIRLATQIGSSLAGICYVLDEPTIGLHARDSERLSGVLRRLAEMDNTVIVVEHDEEIIASATHMIDIGPGAGARGGELVASGTLDEVLDSEASITAKYLTGKSRISLPEQRRPADFTRAVELRGVTANNMKNIDVRFPLGCFICVTGVSGSGKSTLITQVLVRVLRRRISRSGPRPGSFERIVGSANIDKIIEIDQSPIGRTPRSNPATYVGVFDLIRQLYARTREAKIRGYTPARFSFNVKGGRCEHCEGQGTKRISMHFLPDVYVECSSCGGSRYNRETLEVRYRGKNIADVLAMRVEEATTFFENFANIRQRLEALKDVGLGYVTLGQSSNTLSGGEAQRVKLASELRRTHDAHTMYVLDEPTTGLHFADVRNLLTVLNRLADRGHTILVIEHNLDVIKVADWIIDLGPEGGDQGGYIVAEGTPQQVADCEASHTGRCLRDRLADVPPITAARQK
ncbi:MAG: excinuclease ABC subunit UvrA [Phycisphaerales bacterium]|nr:MAG: excinuclease ABC subunit UvrA [Phycisphaerales bacterium]